MDVNLIATQGTSMLFNVGKTNMKMVQVSRTFELRPIKIFPLKSPERLCKIKVDIYKSLEETSSYGIYAIESEDFELDKNGSTEKTEIFAGSQSLLWETIRGESEQDVYQKLAQDIELIYPVEEGVEMRQYEVVKIFEIDTSKDEKDESLKIRIEIMKEFGTELPQLVSKAYTLEYFNLKPSFPVSDNYETTSAAIFVRDDSSKFSNLKGKSVEEILAKISTIYSDSNPEQDDD